VSAEGPARRRYTAAETAALVGPLNGFAPEEVTGYLVITEGRCGELRWVWPGGLTRLAAASLLLRVAEGMFEQYEAGTAPSEGP
jgi:hypothetical protein